MRSPHTSQWNTYRRRLLRHWPKTSTSRVQFLFDPSTMLCLPPSFPFMSLSIYCTSCVADASHRSQRHLVLLKVYCSSPSSPIFDWYTYRPILDRRNHFVLILQYELPLFPFAFPLLRQLLLPTRFTLLLSSVNHRSFSLVLPRPVSFCRASFLSSPLIYLALSLY